MLLNGEVLDCNIHLSTTSAQTNLKVLQRTRHHDI
jgi:hypothetical protein